MNSLFQPMLKKHVLVFFDNILIYSPIWDQHLKHLGEVLQLLTESIFGQQEEVFVWKNFCDYLGHIISGSKVSMDPSKVQCIKVWSTPRNVWEVRGFLGLTGHYRKFIKNYGQLAKPLTELTKKEGFTWNAQAQEAFENLKDKLTSSPVLSLPDFSKEFLVECDAFGQGVGAVLLQEHNQ